MVDAPTEKLCTRCDRTLPLDDFPDMKSGKYGKYAYCRPCHANYQRERARRARTPEENAEIDLKKSMRSQGLKRCRLCQEIKPLDDGFYTNRHGGGGAGHCKACLSSRYRESYLRSQYGLTVAQYEAMLEAQGGACAICLRSFGRIRTNIDHSHVDHTVRAVLCVNCNTKILPIVEYQREVVRAALEYLDAPPAYEVLGRHEVPRSNQARRRARHAIPPKCGHLRVDVSRSHTV